MTRSATQRALDFASILFVVLVLVQSGAQRYDWWFVGLVIPPAVFLLAAQLVLRWRKRAALTLSLTARPTDFERVRTQWEWSRGAGALFNLAAFAALLWAVALEPGERGRELRYTTQPT